MTRPRPITTKPMARPRQTLRKRAFTFLELLIVTAIFFVVLGFLLPALSTPNRRSARVGCVVNLKQTGTAFRMYANDNNEQYPAFSVTNEAWQYFQMAADNLSSPKVLLCPEDTERPKAVRAPLDFNLPPSTNSLADSIHRNNSLSYFYGVDAASNGNAKMWLAGDRNLAVKERLLTGLVALKSNTPVLWTSSIHANQGNIVLADGSVPWANQSSSPRTLLSAFTNETQRLIMP